MLIRIREGHFGAVRLDGVQFGGAFSWPGAIHEGDGTFHVILDERATPEQRDAVVAMTSGAHGGPLFEIFAAVAPRRPDPLVARIEVESDRETRTARVSIPGVIEYHAEPIKNPVTGEEHRAQIRLPNGFEYEEAEMGNSVLLKAAGQVAFEHRNTYAQFNAIDWSNHRS
jgi:hypothetical protein